MASADYRRSKILAGIRAVRRYERYEDELSVEESAETATKEADLKREYARLAARDADILRLVRGSGGQAPRRYSEKADPEIVRRLADKLHQFRPVVLPLEAMPDEAGTCAGGEERKKGLNMYREPGRRGFFPQDGRVWGEVPNSALVDMLWPAVARMKEAEGAAPLLTALDVLQREVAGKLAALGQGPSGESEDEDSETQFFDWGEDEHEEKKWEKKEEPAAVNRFMATAMEPVTPAPLPLQKEASILVVDNSSAPSSSSSQPSPVVSRESTRLPLRKVKFTSPQPPSSPIREKSKSPPPSLPTPQREVVYVALPLEPAVQPIERERSFFLTQLNPVPDKQEPASALPHFLEPFSQESWFQTLLPVVLEHPPTSSAVFCRLLADSALRDWCDWAPLCGVVGALTLLLSGIQDRVLLARVAIVLETRLLSAAAVEADDTQEEDRAAAESFLRAGLRLLASLDCGQNHHVLVRLCLTRLHRTATAAAPQHEHGDINELLWTVMAHLGLNDDTRTALHKEMSSVSISVLLDKRLPKWHQAALNLLERTRDLLAKETSNAYPSRPLSSALETLERFFHINEASVLTSSRPSALLTYVTCLNMLPAATSQRQRRLSRLATAGLDQPEARTVAALPRLADPRSQCLARLGESHALAKAIESNVDKLNSVWARQSIVDRSQHPAMQPLHHYQLSVGGGFVSYLHLLPRPCLLNPFPRLEDLWEWQDRHPNSLADPRRQAVFIQQMSLPPEPF